MTDDDFPPAPQAKRKRPGLSLKARALRLLSMREHSRVELARKLEQHVGPDDDLSALLDALEQAQYLSNSRFSESLVKRRSARYGNSRILAELQSHGVQGEDLQEMKSNLAQDELDRAQQLWRRKFGQVAADAQEKAKQFRFFTQRGFSAAVVRQVLKGAPDDDQD
ncbi:recombination regulator RecX [Massilia sp. W12]|uniref:recombination regulator RecX n=1 Tax=Massilia sp. W12 TaxID=3126507 RepID=UPI0030D5D935